MNDVEKLKKRIKELEDALEKKDDELKNVKKDFEDTKKEFEDTKKEFEDTKKEFEEFKAKHSHTVGELQKALKIKENKVSSGKPIGAPKGHKGYSRHVPERVDVVKVLNPKKCPDCGSKLGETQEIRKRYVTDIKIVLKPVNTEYDIHRKYCTGCKKLVEQPVPNVLPHARFGLNLMLFIMYLKLGLRLPGNKVCEFLLTMYGLKISEGEIVHILKQLANVFGDYYSYLEKIVKLARVKYTDATSWRVNGKNYFAWTFITAGVVLYKIRKRANAKVPLVLFGTKQENNTLVSDRHSANISTGQKTGFNQQYCWSHILRNSKSLAKDFGSEGKYVHGKLKDIYELAKGLNHQGLPEQEEALQGEIINLTQRHYKHNTIRKFVNNLAYRDINSLFRFVTDSEIDSTNNISERELRHLVLIRKISNGSRSTRGANATAMLLSITQTLRLNKQNTLKGLFNILNNPSRY